MSYEEIGDLGECEDPSVGFELRAQECIALPVLLAQQSAAQHPFGAGAMAAGTMTSLIALTMGLVY